MVCTFVVDKPHNIIDFMLDLMSEGMHDMEDLHGEKIKLMIKVW